jgi:hypothetical protein
MPEQIFRHRILQKYYFSPITIFAVSGLQTYRRVMFLTFLFHYVIKIVLVSL